MIVVEKIYNVKQFFFYKEKICYLIGDRVLFERGSFSLPSSFFGHIYNHNDVKLIVQNFFGFFQIYDSKIEENSIEGFYIPSNSFSEYIYFFNKSKGIVQVLYNDQVYSKSFHYKGLLYSDLYILILENNSKIEIYNSNNEQLLAAFSISSLGTYTDGVSEKPLSVTQFCGVYNNIFICSLNSGGVILLDIETCEIVNFFKTLRMPYNLQPKDDGSNIYWGLIGRQFVEIDAAKKEIVRNVSLDRQTRKIKNISENTPNWFSIGTSKVYKGLIYFLAEKNFVGVFDPTSEEIINYYEIQFDKQTTTLKGGKENLQIKDNSIYVLDSEGTMYVIEQ